MKLLRMKKHLVVALFSLVLFQRLPETLVVLHGLVKFNRILIHGRNLLKVRIDYEEPNPPCYFLLMRHKNILSFKHKIINGLEVVEKEPMV